MLLKETEYGLIRMRMEVKKIGVLIFILPFILANFAYPMPRKTGKDLFEWNPR